LFDTSICPFVFTSETKGVSLSSLSIDSLSLPSSSLFSFTFSRPPPPSPVSHSNTFSHSLSLSSSNISNIIGTILPSFINCDVEDSIDLQLEGNQLKNCKSELSEWGGAISFFLSHNGHLLVKDCSLSVCEASKQSFSSSSSFLYSHQNDPPIVGHGGFIFIDSEYEEEPSPLSLSFLFDENTYLNNNASRGRDLFLHCYSIEDQISEFNFNWGIEKLRYNKENAMFYTDKENEGKEEGDLFKYIDYYSNVIIHVSKTKGGEDVPLCGSSSLLCRSLLFAFRHVEGEKDAEGRVLIEEEVEGKDVIEMESVILKGFHDIAIVDYVCDENQENAEYLFKLKNNVEIEKISVEEMTDSKEIS
jgi:hypothetical protein